MNPFVGPFKPKALFQPKKQLGPGYAVKAAVSSAPTAPSAPVLSVDGVGDTYADLSWTVPADHGSAITEYRFYTALHGGSFSLATIDTPPSTSGEYNVFSPETQYDCYITAVNGIGESAHSNTVTFTTTS